MARLFPSPVKVKGKKKKAMAEERVRDCDCARIINDHHGVPQLSESPPGTIYSELRRREFLFSIGMSCYLLHLIANGREEIHKIVELRNDIEKLLECKNDEMRRKQQEFVELRNEIDKLLQDHNDDLRRKQRRFASGKQEQCGTTSGAVETSSDCYYSPQLMETSLSVGGEGSFERYVFKGKGEDFGEDMDQLEAELEAEFELLQIGHNQEKCEEDSSGIRPMEEQQQGVCPFELERKLHELMETRQEEKINELQTALEDAKQRLHVKEAEASWWKDTAYIVSEHVPQPSRINHSSQTRQYPLSRVLKLPSPIRFFLQAQVKMQAVIRSFVSGGNVVRSSLLQHLRVVNPAIQPSVLSTRYESTQPARMEEHGFESTTISDVMNAKGKSADGSWLWCTTDDTVYDAVKSMTQHNVGALVVVKPGEQQSLAGIITERDYLRKIIVQGRSSKSTKVGDIMTEENKLITVTPETKVLVAMQLMTDNRIRHIPVIKDKGMIGMVSIGDVVRAVVTEHPMGMELKRSAIAFLLLLFVHAAHSFYLPGVAPQDFEKGDELKVKVNKLTSIKTQLPYSYYSLPFCQPKKIVDSTENLGEVLRGDRIENAPYSFKMREAQMCNILCRVTLDAKTAKAFKEKIDDEYRVNMILDNLPLVVPIERVDQGSPAVVYQLGYHVGLKGQYEGSKEQKFFMHNHLAFTVRYHRDVETDAARIVGFEVKPYSVKHEYDGEWSEKTRLTTCDPHKKRLVVSSSTPQEVEQKKEIIFTYDESEVKWASRWDAYLLMNDNQIHWFSIVNSLMIVLFLSGMVAMIMLRTLYRDISRYNELETQEEAQEETGWKLVHGDVFRLPANSDLLCVYVGTGVQCLGMVLVTMIFAMLGFLSPSNRGGLMTAMLLLWVFMGLFAGYASSRLYKMFKGTEWKRIAFRTAFLFPAVVSSIFFVLNALIWGQKSSGAVPFGTMFALIFLWFGISVPLVFVGAYLGFKKPAVDDPVKTNKIPRQIPEQAWYMNPVFSILIGGILPFGAVFIELFFILTSIWLNQFYYIFGFLFLVFVILIVTCAEITVVLCYFQLCSEDYLWWWRSYLTSGSSALYLFLYATFYFFTKLQITKLVSAMLYFGYMLIASYAFFVLTGTIGFYACLWFTRLIYSSANNQNGRHTIILLQNSPSRATRTFMDYDSIGQAIDGICGLYERKLKEINPSLRNLSYDIADLYNFIDGLTDLSALVYEHSMNAYLPYDRQWIKQKALHHLKKLAKHAEILRLDQARVNSIHSKLSKKLTDRVRQSKSTDLPAKDGSTYGSGNFVVTLGIGTPKHDLSLIFDTGSDLTWIQCEPCVRTCYSQKEPIFNPSSSSSYHNVSCSSAECSSLSSATGNSGTCSASNCVYGIQYGDQSFSVGFLAKEKFTLTASNVFDGVNFGCGENNQGLFTGVAGLLGLGRDKLSFPSQTAATYNKIFSYCLPSSASYTGHLTFGSAGVSRSVKFTPISTITDGTSFYGLDVVGISVGGQKLAIPPTVFSTPGALIDSGTVISRLPPKAYAALRGAFKAKMSQYKNTSGVSILDTCFDLTGLKTVTIPTVSFYFNGGAVVQLGSKGVLYAFKMSQVCLAFAGNSDDNNAAIFGNVQQQTLEVVYDGAAGRVGFAPNGCS